MELTAWQLQLWGLIGLGKGESKNGKKGSDIGDGNDEVLAGSGLIDFFGNSNGWSSIAIEVS